MTQFDLKKYLAKNILLERELSAQEQAIVDDILKNINENIEESMQDVGEKMKQYAKKGLLSAAIVASVCGVVSCKNNDFAIDAIKTELYSLDREINSEKISSEGYLNAAMENKENYDLFIAFKKRYEESNQKIKDLQKEKTQLLTQLADLGGEPD